MAERLRELVLASGNEGKRRELAALLEPLGWQLRPQSEWDIAAADEHGLTFMENALIKARHASRHAGLPALGDDSGLMVDALAGAPGLRSARYAGENASDEQNNRKLLDALLGIPVAGRSASFYCAMVLVRSAGDPAPLFAAARWRGSVLQQPRGTGGFGYDPLFLPMGGRSSAAELDPAIKNRQSHRGQALARLVRQLRSEPL